MSRLTTRLVLHSQHPYPLIPLAPAIARISRGCSPPPNQAVLPSQAAAGVYLRYDMYESQTKQHRPIHLTLVPFQPRRLYYLVVHGYEDDNDMDRSGKKTKANSKSKKFPWNPASPPFPLYRSTSHATPHVCVTNAFSSEELGTYFVVLCTYYYMYHVVVHSTAMYVLCM